MWHHICHRWCTLLVATPLLIDYAAAQQLSTPGQTVQSAPSVLRGRFGIIGQGRPVVEITDIDIGEPIVGTNAFRARLTNPTDTDLLVVLDLRATPGMWLGPNWQRQFGIDLAPRQERVFEATYEFQRMSPDAQLRLRLGPGHRSPAGNFVLDSIAFERRFPVGDGNPAALDVERYFTLVRRPPLEIYAWRGSLAAERIDDIARTRLAAIQSIKDILDVVLPERIRLVFYPDSASKTEQTGHIGAGWATGFTIVEIYNDEIQLDPYHELAHVLTAEFGELPAMFDEGFAVFVSERLGSDALEHLGSQGASVDETVCRFFEAGTAFKLQDLSALADIGSPESRAPISYPQSASVVKYLLETYGVERFRMLFRALALAEGGPAERTAAVLQRVLGLTTLELGAGWRASVEARCG